MVAGEVKSSVTTADELNSACSVDNGAWPADQLATLLHVPLAPPCHMFCAHAVDPIAVNNRTTASAIRMRVQKDEPLFIHPP